MNNCIKLSIIIVNYKNQDLILNCVNSILVFENQLSYEVIVIDNNSQDDTENKLHAIYPELVWVQKNYNSGFGRAINAGIKKAKGEIILFLNSDIIINKTNTLANSISHYKQLPNFTNYIMGIRLIDFKGNYQQTLRLEFYGCKNEIRTNPIYIFLKKKILRRKNNIFEKEKIADNYSGEVKWINAAFLIMDRNTILNNGLFFDNDFFLYAEDNEWCWRASKKGIKFYHWHEQELIHLGSGSMPNYFLKRCQITASLYLLIYKTKTNIYYITYLSIIFFNLILNGILFFFLKIRKKNTSSYLIEESHFRKISWYLLIKYGISLLFKKTLSDNNSFYVNCYEDKFIKKAQQKFIAISHN